MGCLVHAGILKEDKTLTDKAKNNFINEVKELLVYGSNTPTPSPFPCGDPIPPPNPPLRMEDFPLEDEKLYESFHRDIIKNQYEKTAASLDTDSTFSLLPLLADPMALATAFGVKLPPVPFPDGFVPYLTGQLVPKFILDLLKAGVTDFPLPPMIVPELLKLVAPPALPAVPPLPPIELPSLLPLDVIPTLPTGSLAPPTVTAPGLPAIPQIPPVSIPPPPTVALSDVYLRDLAILESVPKVIAGVIAEIPKLVSKIANPLEILSFICGKVKESGMFGVSSPENDLERAAATVLSRKIAECIFCVSIAKTLGSGYGGLNAAVGSTLKYDPPPPEPPTRPTQKDSPSEKVAKYAEKVGSINQDGSYGLSYGGTSTSYVESVLYYETFLSRVKPKTVNVFGEPLAEIPSTSGLTREAIKNNLELQKKHAMEDNRAFFTYADYAARDYSSCAMFGRACYYRAGAINKFFCSMYHSATATAGLRYLGAFRNYRWIFKDQNGQFTGLNQELINVANSVEEATQWYVKGGKPKSDSLNPSWLKPLEERAMWDVETLSDIARETGRLKIERGDMMLVAVVNSAGAESKEHLAVFINDQDLSFEDSLSDINKVFTVDGGQEDDLNLGPVSTDKLSNKYENDQEFLDAVGYTMAPGGTGRIVPEEALNGNHYIVTGEGDSTKVYKIVRRVAPKTLEEAKAKGGGKEGEWADNWLRSEISEKLLVKKPTAILRARYDMGYVNRSEGIAAGFYMAKKLLFSSQQGKFLGDEDAKAPAGETRKVVAVFKTKNFLDPVENADVTDREQARQIFKAILAQDNHPLMDGMYDLPDFNRKQLIDLGFRSLPSGKAAPKDKDPEKK